MAKTAKFVRNEVVDKATQLYWKKGFHATSMRNLQDEIDMRPGSIYAAFGNKDGLFKEALRNYTDMGIAQLQQYQQMHGSPLKALSEFVKAQVIDTQDSAPNGICMLSKTIAELTDDNQELIDITRGHLREIASEFVNLIEKSQELGELDNKHSAEDLANHLQVQIAGLRTFAKINNDKSLLNRMIENIFIHYPFNGQ
ncbi:TetR family transcriptional regulator [Psychromonas sp. psych-6C06]|uniref:TetR/AcrR family transcriptional regulator n=1 Tax=Psychromonas sp. psych-6C06 TaxID=2058089 RepID=UPI000C331286|nr:TetR/AcrR family transcriptional regulator [Psychromonas sp. psych-6C06]PKF62030.1 TetR family transcriptional regulator [Psychromonas sp. psych-6C06]